MYNNRPVLAIVPARIGSKGLRRKNVRPLLGRPLIEWTIVAARASKYIDRVIVSTDAAEIAAIAKNCGTEVPFLRPARLAGDRALIADAVLYTIDRLKKECDEQWKYVVLLQPTSPLRDAEDIDAAIRKFFLHKNASALVSITEASENPLAMHNITGKGFLKALLPKTKKMHRRQDLPRVYKMNGAIYICKVSVLRRKKTFHPEKTLAFIMPREKSIDIDDGYDFDIAKMVMKKTHSNKREIL